MSQFSVVPGISGSWYDPDQSGHGFLLEVINEAPDTLNMAWFTFDNLGDQAWITGLGPISGNHATVDALRVMNGRFPPYFDAGIVERMPWGTLTFTFVDCTHATVTWNSIDGAFTPTGEMHLVRLTSIKDLACP